MKTLASITGQPEEDVVAMLKQHGGDVNAATNALMDMEKFEVVVKGGKKKKEEAPKPRAREAKSSGREKRAGDKREQKRDGRTGGKEQQHRGVSKPVLPAPKGGSKPGGGGQTRWSA